MGPDISNAAILATLRELNEKVSTPLWLFGGVAVDFLVGRWTRPHSDIDLNTLSTYRKKLTHELNDIGYHTSDSGWLTLWFQAGTGRRLEIVFLERGGDGLIALHIGDASPVGIPGTYPMVPDYLDADRFAELDDVRFRVSSPVGEWLARSNSLDVVGGRTRDAKLEHDRKLLESLIPADELARLLPSTNRSGKHSAKPTSPNRGGSR